MPEPHGPVGSSGANPGARRTIGVFCGSRLGSDPAYHKLAEGVGIMAAACGWSIVYGGGDVGLMGTVADAAMRAGGRVDGFIPERLMDREVGKTDISRLEITTDMFERKRLMIEGSSAFLALPGGLGTLDEILDVITLRQLGYHNKPMVLLGPAGFWQPFTQLISHVVAHEFADERANGLFVQFATVDAAWDHLEAPAVDPRHPG